MKFERLFDSLVLVLLVLVVYLFTLSPLLREFAPYVLFVCSVFFGVLYVLGLEKENSLWRFQAGVYKTVFYFFVSAVLLWVGMTGWFVSPVFSVLYLLTVAVVFLFSSSVGLAFSTGLIAILLTQFNHGNLRFDMVNVLGMFLMVPFAYSLGRIYLQVKEKEKKILILRCEHKRFRSSVDELLDNKLTRFFAEVRQPLSDIRQIAYYVPKFDTAVEVEQSRRRIIAETEEALHMLARFEESTTGRVFLDGPR